MSVSQLTLGNIAELDDGLLAAAFAANVREIVNDMLDRPSDGLTRTLTVTLAFTPEQIGGDLDRVKLEHKVAAKIPSREGRTCILTPVKLGKSMQLQFANSGVDARQPEFDFDNKDEE